MSFIGKDKDKEKKEDEQPQKKSSDERRKSGEGTEGEDVKQPPQTLQDQKNREIAAQQSHISGQAGTSQTMGAGDYTRRMTDEEIEAAERYQPQGLAQQGYFQSEEARNTLADPSKADELNEKGIRSARIDDVPVGVTVINDPSKFEKQVVVRPRQTVNRFKVGDTWYSLREGQECTVPQHVATLLEQKGII